MIQNLFRRAASAILGLSLASSAAAQFDSPGLVSSLGRPEVVGMGEFSGDSFPDLVTSSAESERFFFHFGRGDLRFLFPITVVVDGRPSAIRVVDADQDGHDDVVWVDGDTGAFGVVYQLSVSPPVFATTRLAGADEAHELVMVDLDGDTWLDAVVTHRGADAVTIYRNQFGTFLPGEEAGVGDGPQSVAARVWGPTTTRMAVVQAGVLSDNVGIYDGALAPIQILPLPQPAFVTHVDWDLDAWPDLLVARRDGRVHVYGGDQNGRFGPRISWSIEAGASQIAVLDQAPGASHRVAVVETSRQRLAVYELDPTGPVGPPYASFLGPNVDRFILGDADLDGRRELYAPIPAENQVVLIEERDDGTWTGFPTVLSGGLPAQAEVVEASGGLPLRLAVLCLVDHEIWIYERAGGTLTPTAVLPIADDAIRFRWAWIDGDPAPDLVVLTDSSGVDIFLADGASFQPPQRLAVSGDFRDLVALPHGPGPNTDLVLADVNVTGLRVFEGDGLGGFTEGQTFTCQDTPIRLHDVDLDADQRTDLVVLGDVNKVCLVYNDATGFESWSVFQVGEQPRGVDTGLLVDDDELPDIVVGNAGENTFSVLTSIFPRIFAHSVQGQVTPSGAQVALQADLSRRGINDLIFASPSSSNISIHQNAGSGVFVIPQRQRASSLPLDMATLDVDENGWTDLVLLNGLGNSLVILLNRRDQVAPVETVPATPLPSGAQVWLEPPYPNPSNGNVVLRARADAADVDLAIYDLRGRLVRRLIPRPEGSGLYTAAWTGLDSRGREVARGRYMVRLRAGGQDVSRSLTLR